MTWRRHCAKSRFGKSSVIMQCFPVYRNRLDWRYWRNEIGCRVFPYPGLNVHYPNCSDAKLRTVYDSGVWHHFHESLNISDALGLSSYCNVFVCHPLFIFLPCFFDFDHCPVYLSHKHKTNWSRSRGLLLHSYVPVPSIYPSTQWPSYTCNISIFIQIHLLIFFFLKMHWVLYYNVIHIISCML